MASSCSDHVVASVPIQADVQCLTRILPEEVWGVILGNLTSSTDRFNAIHAFPLFDSLLQSKKTFWLFELILPHIFKDLHKSDILNLRLVCKAWSKTVDTWISNHPSLQPFSPACFQTIQANFNYLPLSSKFYDDLSFVNGDQFQEFLESMDNHPRNPFFGRSIRIGSCGDIFDMLDEDTTPLWQGADTLCRKFGQHLWHVEFCNYEFSLSSLQFYRGVQQTLQNLPNLRSLHMNGALDHCPTDDDGQFLDFMALNPLPILPHLDTLILDMVLEQEAPPSMEDYTRLLPQDPDELVQYLQQHPEYIQELLRHVPPCPETLQERFMTTYGTQLQKLEISLTSWQPLYSRILKNLRELHLKQVTSIGPMISLLHGLSSKILGRLMLSLRCSMKTSQLLQLLAPLQIRSLDFGYLGEAPENYLVDDTPSSPLPPKVTSLLFLRLKDSTQTSYEFLAHFPELQHLDVWECQNARRRWEQQGSKRLANNEAMTITDQLRRFIYGNEGATSNASQVTIWTLLPSLKVITYRTRSGLPSLIKRYSREGQFWVYVCSY